jgi:dihydroflavonol-4-reductase
VLAQGHGVRGFARSVAAGSADVEWRSGSVLDEHAVADACAGVDGVFHLAGQVEHTRRQGYAAMRALNVRGTLNVLRATDAPIVAASTSGVVAVSAHPGRIADDQSPYASRLTIDWPYYATKIEAERAARDWAGSRGRDVTFIRPSLLLGPDDTGGESTALVHRLLGSRVPVAPSGGLSWVDVRDVALVMREAMLKTDGVTTAIVTTTNETFIAFFERVAALSGVPAPTRRLPYWLAHTGARLVTAVGGLVGRADPAMDPVVVEMTRHYWYADAGVASASFGFQPRPADDTLRETIDWLREHADIPRI